jgi:hypothetical protein
VAPLIAAISSIEGNWQRSLLLEGGSDRQKFLDNVAQSFKASHL